VTGRTAQLVPRGLAANTGTADETLGLRGLRFGPSAGFRYGLGASEAFAVTLRLGAGLFLGSAVDARHGHFTTSGGTPYATDQSESVATQYVYLAPEVRISRALGSHFDVGVGVAGNLMLSLNQPEWRNQQTALAGLPNATASNQSDGFASFPQESTAGSFIVSLVPGVDVRYAF